MKHIKLFESFLNEAAMEAASDEDLKTKYVKPNISETAVSMIDEDMCPICKERFVMQCKCGGPVKHSIQHLIKGHGKVCQNGHRWSYQTEDGNLIIKE